MPFCQWFFMGRVSFSGGFAFDGQGKQENYKTKKPTFFGWLWQA